MENKNVSVISDQVNDTNSQLEHYEIIFDKFLET